LSVTATGQWFSTNKTDRNEVNGILFKVALNTIPPPKIKYMLQSTDRKYILVSILQFAYSNKKQEILTLFCHSEGEMYNGDSFIQLKWNCFCLSVLILSLFCLFCFVLFFLFIYIYIFFFRYFFVLSFLFLSMDFSNAYYARLLPIIHFLWLIFFYFVSMRIWQKRMRWRGIINSIYIFDIKEWMIKFMLQKRKQFDQNLGRFEWSCTLTCKCPRTSICPRVIIFSQNIVSSYPKSIQFQCTIFTEKNNNQPLIYDSLYKCIMIWYDSHLDDSFKIQIITITILFYMFSRYIYWIPLRRGVIKFVSDLQQVSGFLRVLRFPPPIKLTATI
jgi:hypothetical protein